ncbi:MAG: ribonuclease P protein component [Chloroflexi bacterium]|nr:ribonuclease P protein component [Chloroflexota bacterium]
MLPKRYRLTKSSDFERVHAEGRCWSNRLLVMCISPNGLPYSRFGFSVSKRIGKAVVRNRIKRLLREAVRPLCDLTVPGWDVVFIARAGIVQADWVAIQQAVTSLFNMAQLFRHEQEPCVAE